MKKSPKNKYSDNWLVIMDILLQLHAEALEYDELKTLRTCTISSGAIRSDWDPGIDFDESRDKAFKFLKTSRIIKAFRKLPNRRMPDDLEDFELVMVSDDEFFEIEQVECDYYPDVNKIEHLLEDAWHDTKSKIAKLADMYLQFLEFITAYLENPTNDKKVFTAYNELVREIRKQVHNMGGIFVFSQACFDGIYIPSENIMLLQKEMQDKNIDKNNILVELRANYGLILEELKKYELESYRKKQILDNTDIIKQVVKMKDAHGFLGDTKSGKIKLQYSEHKGIYNAYDNSIFYAVAKKSHRGKTIKMLKGKYKLISELAKSKDPKKIKAARKEIKDINEIFLKKFPFKEKLILRDETGGYRLNKEFFEIDFKLL